MYTIKYNLELKATTFTKEQIQNQLNSLTAQGVVQVAFAGRSNVGKSSLINALARRRKLAKISSTPGKTRSLNFYEVEPTKFSIVDLPGYGYARCSQKERQNWANLIEYYFLASKGLKCLVLLLDCRVNPQGLDHNLAQFAKELRLFVLPVLTKVDKCSQAEISQKQQIWAEFFSGETPLPISAKKGKGIERLWKAMHHIVKA